MSKLHIAIACGGTGGHLFPGLAVGDALVKRDVDVSLLISPKQVDQEAVKTAQGMEILTLPAVGLQGKRLGRFLWAFGKSYRVCRRYFRDRSPAAVLAMGGFTSAPPILAGRARGATTFLHESNTIPGRANRWLTRSVDQAFVGFDAAIARLRHPEVMMTGTPVRPLFRETGVKEARRRLGLNEDRPVLVVTGGSQGALALNHLALAAVPKLQRRVPGLQVVHLTGLAKEEEVRAAYSNQQESVVVKAFSREMECVLAAATVVVSRAGASSLAEISAVGVPSILVPYPAAVEDHQYHNATAFSQAGAALILNEKEATGDSLVAAVVRLIEERDLRASMANALKQLDAPGAADQIAEQMLARIGNRSVDQQGVNKSADGGKSADNKIQTVAA